MELIIVVFLIMSLGFAGGRKNKWEGKPTKADFCLCGAIVVQNKKAKTSTLYYSKHWGSISL